MKLYTVIYYKDYLGKIVSETVQRRDGNVYVTESGKIVSPTRVVIMDIEIYPPPKDAIPIGWIIYPQRSRNAKLMCISCKLVIKKHQWLGLLVGGPVYHDAIYPYKATCYICGSVLVEPKPG